MAAGRHRTARSKRCSRPRSRTAGTARPCTSRRTPSTSSTICSTRSSRVIWPRSATKPAARPTVRSTRCSPPPTVSPATPATPPRRNELFDLAAVSSTAVSRPSAWRCGCGATPSPPRRRSSTTSTRRDHDPSDVIGHAQDLRTIVRPLRVGRAGRYPRCMLLAELEVWHTRPAVPTRRVCARPPRARRSIRRRASAGCCSAPSSPGTSMGVDDELHPDVHRLIDQIERGDRVVQPRLRHRFQVDRHGLARSRHRLIGNGDDLSFDLDSSGTNLAQVLGAVYAVERLELASRHVDRAGAAQGGAVAWSDRAGADRPPRRRADDDAVGARRPDRVGAGRARASRSARRRRPRREVTIQYRLRMRASTPTTVVTRPAPGGRSSISTTARRILSGKGRMSAVLLLSRRRHRRVASEPRRGRARPWRRHHVCVPTSRTASWVGAHPTGHPC